MNTIDVGYVIVSKEITNENKPVGYFYREEPDNDRDSGWRFFSGEENQSYVDDANNFSKFNASTLLNISPQVRYFLDASYPIAFELLDGEFIEVDNG